MDRPRPSAVLLALIPLALALALAVPLAAQATGALAGRVRDAATGRGIGDALVSVGDGRRGAVTDTSGQFRIREVRSGTYAVQVRAIGYRPVTRDSVTVRSTETTMLDVVLEKTVIEVAPVTVEAPDQVLDPLATQTEQRVTAADLRQLPVTTLAEAIALQAGVVGQSYRGGRFGQESFILDGLGVKNQLDASTGGLGLAIPPDMLTEASLVTNGFSARYGQALSGMINVVTKDGGERWSGRLAYETDRPLGAGGDYGLDRMVAQADGPVIGGVRAVASLDLTGRLDADPVNAPRPLDPRDPRSGAPGLLPHNSGEQYNAAGKLTIPIGGRETLRLFALRSVEQRLLYDPVFKYDEQFAPGQKTVGMLLSGHLQHASAPTARLPFVVDLRGGYFMRDFVRGTVVDQPDARFGAFTFDKFHFAAEDAARAQDTVGTLGRFGGFTGPDFSERTPWGVPAFFLGDASRGDIAWNQYRELRGQLDLTFGLGRSADLYAGTEITRGDVKTFQRVLGYLPVGDSVPRPTAGHFQPVTLGAYTEAQFRAGDLGVTAGLRLDRFDARSTLGGTTSKAVQRLNPRVAVSTVLSGATVVASMGGFSQPPDYQFLLDAAFDDTTRTGRFRQGNPNLGFERSWQYELSVRGRPRPGVSVRTNVFVKQLFDLVSSVPLGTSADSSIFGNSDGGTVKGAEVIFEREFRDGWGVRANYTLQQATATSTSGFLLRRLITIDPLTHDTTFPAKVQFPLDYDRRHNVTLVLQGQVPEGVGPRLGGVNPLAGFEAALVGRYSSGLPYTRIVPGTDTTLAVPNDARLPALATLDLLVRRPLRLFGARGSVYLDARNLLNRRNIVAVRRDTGLPFATDSIIATAARSAYLQHPEAIPYESPRYRAEADLNHDGLLSGEQELLPLYQAAAQDYFQPLFAYGPPRLMRLGMEFVF